MSTLEDLIVKGFVVVVEADESVATQRLEDARRFRRNRNRSEYGSKTFGEAEVPKAIGTARAIQAACSKLR